MNIKIFLFVGIIVLTTLSTSFAKDYYQMIEKNAVEDDSFACDTQTLMSEIINMIKVGDKIAASKMLDKAFSSKRCIPLKKGEVLYVTLDTSQSGHYLKVRQEGNTNSYWVYTRVTFPSFL